MKRSLYSLHKDYDFGSGIWGTSTAQSTESIMETIYREGTTQQHRDQDLKAEMEWDGLHKLIFITQNHNQYVVLTA